MSRKQLFPTSRKRQRPARTDHEDPANEPDGDDAEQAERQRRHDVGE